jgi:hypothetical protein
MVNEPEPNATSTPRPDPRKDVVEIPRRALIASGVVVLAVLVAGLVAIAYWAGRDSARWELRAPDARTSPAVPPPAPAVAPAAASPSPAEAPITSADTVSSTPPPVAVFEPLTSAPSTPPAPEAQAANPAREAVARYLSEVEAIEGQARYWNDPQVLARTLVDQGARGETSGFDRLIETNRTALARLRSLAVPEACSEHHSATVPLMEEAIGLLERLKRGIGSEAGSLEDVPALAQDLERRGRQVDALAAELKRRYRIP